MRVNRQEAAGFIETCGYLPAVEAADVCLKTANVSLASKQNSGGGLITIIIRGDVGAVKAAVEAGTMAADRLGKVVSTHVIARPAQELDALLAGVAAGEGAGAQGADTQPESRVEQQVEQLVEQPSRQELLVEKASEPEQAVVAPEPSALPTAEELKVHRTVDLRNMARQLPGFGMSKQQIKFAKKAELIKAMIEYHQRVK